MRLKTDEVAIKYAIYKYRYPRVHDLIRDEDGSLLVLYIIYYIK